ALVAMQQAFLAQNIDGLAHGDPRHLELALELDQSGDFLAGLPLPAFDALTHHRRDLDIEGNTAAAVGLQELGHARCHQVVWTGTRWVQWDESESISIARATAS